MKILLSNDDGVYAPGIILLAEHLAAKGELTVMAPDRDRSGASNSLTLDRPLRVQKLPNEFYSVNGTPTDCVHLAITGWLQGDPDMVISGINHGANLGDDVIYSGTVAAAMEGRCLGFPAIAVSLVGTEGKYYETAAQVVCRLVDYLRLYPFPSDVILNVNVPDRPFAELAGIQVTRLGSRHRAEPVIMGRDPRGKEVFWIGAAGPGQDTGPGTDFYAIQSGYVSLTPLQVDLTRHSILDQLSHWLSEFRMQG